MFLYHWLLVLSWCHVAQACPISWRKFAATLAKHYHQFYQHKPRSNITKQPKTSVKKSSTQNSGHEGIKCHQPNFFQTSSDMSLWISEIFINLGQFLDMKINFWMKLVPSKRRTKIARFTSNFFAYAKFSGRRSWSWVFKFFLGKLRYVMMNFWNFHLPMSILSTLSEFLKIKKGGQFFNILCAGIRIVQLRPRTESRDRLSTNQERCP